MSVAENMSGLLQQSCWYPRNPFHSIRPILGDRLLNSLKIIGARSNKFVVDQAALDRYVQQAVRERGVGSRRELQVQGGEFCRCGATRIGNDKLSRLTPCKSGRCNRCSRCAVRPVRTYRACKLFHW